MSVSPADRLGPSPGRIRRVIGRVGSHRLRRILQVALLSLVMVYAAILRLDALTQVHGAVPGPTWLRNLQGTVGSLRVLRPSGFKWSPAPAYPHADGPATRYRSDPYTYLQRARHMSSFYEASRREPVFPFVTRVFLRCLRNDDIAVSFASMAFSVLAVLATFMLGAEAFGYWVGAGASLAVAIEYDLISAGFEGWRDDAFACAVVLTAYAMLRLRRAPSFPNAALLGVVGGLACLVRITSLSFLIPGFLWLAATISVPGTSWSRERGQALLRVGLAALLTTAILAPFAVNCWRVFGDPLYSINVHAGVYRAAEGQAVESGLTARTYIWNEFRSRPAQTVETVAVGMTTYPFDNKWRGFAPWSPRLGDCLSWASLAGLVLFVCTACGRTLLVVLTSSLVPYAVTWRLAADWRFTEHSYPFLLIAAVAAIGWLVGWAAPARWRALRTRTAAEWRAAALRWAAGLAVVAAGYYAVARALPAAAVRERLAARDEVTIVVGGRDAAFFGHGWSKPHGDFLVRHAQGARAVVWLPLPAVADYGVTVRLNPFPPLTGDIPAQLPVVRILLNGALLRAFTLTWDPQRFGSYDLVLPRSGVRAGFNRLEMVADGGPMTFSIWYVRVRPLG